jgi:UDP-N-acetylglucosamine acyltransferase
VTFSTESLIHPTAVVHPSAKLHPNVRVGANAVIEADVIIDSGTVIAHRAVIGQGTILGENNQIYPGAMVGAITTSAIDEMGTSETETSREEAVAGKVILGSRNYIREHVIIERGPSQDTLVGDDNLLMGYVFIGYGAQVADNVVMVNWVNLGAHVHVAPRAILGGLAFVFPNVWIGRGVMIGGKATVRQDIPPFMLAADVPARVRCLNTIGLSRIGISPRGDIEGYRLLRLAHRLLYRSDLTLAEALVQIHKIEPHPQITELTNFIEASLERVPEHREELEED